MSEISKFISSLRQKILISDENDGYIQLGDVSSYHAPKIVSEAYNECMGYDGYIGIFPAKTKMRIYPRGYITVNRDVIYVENDIFYLRPSDIHFDRGMKMKISGRGFRKLKIDLSLFSGDLFQTDCNVHEKVQKQDFYDSWKKKPYTALYVDIKFRHFVGGKESLQKLSDKELLQILQSEEEFTKHITKDALIHYRGVRL